MADLPRDLGVAEEEGLLLVLRAEGRLPEDEGQDQRTGLDPEHDSGRELAVLDGLLSEAQQSWGFDPAGGTGEDDFGHIFRTSWAPVSLG